MPCGISEGEEVMKRKIKVPTLETERLILRMWNKKDAPDVFEYSRNPNVGPISGWKPHESISESKMIIEEIFLSVISWAIVDRSAGKVIGSIGFENDNARAGINSKEIGYSLSEDYWGHGLMTEAAKRVIEYGFEVLGLDIIAIRTSEKNFRSQGVIRKCGFTYEGTLRNSYKAYNGELRESRCYSLLREEYEARR